MVGSDLNGKQISTAIQQKIERSDGLVAIFSKRDPLQDGKWSTHPWIIEEATWAHAKDKQVLRIVEGGVTCLGGIQGDVEEVRFPTERFELCIPKVLSFAESIAKNTGRSPTIQGVKRRDVFSIVPNEPVEGPWSEEVKRLIEEARNSAERQDFQAAFDLSTRAVKMEPNCWRAHINRGVASVHLGCYQNAEHAFDYVMKNFSDHNTVVARALHNKGWLISMRDGVTNYATFQERKELYMQALALDNRRIFSRALVLIYMALLGEAEKSRPFLEASLKWSGFVEALREELDSLGTLGLNAVQHFPMWLRDLLYPTEGTTDGGRRYEI